VCSVTNASGSQPESPCLSSNSRRACRCMMRARCRRPGCLRVIRLSRVPALQLALPRAGLTRWSRNCRGGIPHRPRSWSEFSDSLRMVSDAALTQECAARIMALPNVRTRYDCLSCGRWSSRSVRLAGELPALVGVRETPRSPLGNVSYESLASFGQLFQGRNVCAIHPLPARSVSVSVGTSGNPPPPAVLNRSQTPYESNGGARGTGRRISVDHVTCRSEISTCAGLMITASASE
jgi:hypothetical protein